MNNKSHDFKRVEGRDKYSDMVMCGKCGYISWHSNDGNTLASNNFDKKLSQYRQEQIPKTCIQ